MSSSVRVFCKFYPQVDTTYFDIDRSATVKEVKQQIRSLTNLDESDHLKIIFNAVTISSDSASLWDLDAKSGDTFHVIVDKMADATKKFKVTKSKQDHNQLNHVSDQAILNIFTFLDAKTLASVSLVYRKWKVFAHNNQALWRYNCTLLFSEVSASHFEKSTKAILPSVTSPGDKKTEEEEEAGAKEEAPKEEKFILKGTYNFKDWYIRRHLEQKRFADIEKFSIGSTTPENLAQLKFKKPKEMKITKKPKELNDEERQFLKDNDPKVLRKNLRKDKTAKEKLKKYNQYHKRQEEFEHGTWKSVPEEYLQFNYIFLKKHTFGLDSSKEGFSCHFREGKFYVLKNGQLAFVGCIEPDQDHIKFSKVYVEEGDEQVYKPTGSDAHDAEVFFNVLKQVASPNIVAKSYVEVVKGVEQKIKCDAYVKVSIKYSEFNIAVTGREFEPSLREEAPSTSSYEDGLPAPTSASGPFVRRKLKQQFSIAVEAFDSEDPVAIETTLDNVVRSYAEMLSKAERDDSIGSISFPSIEGLFLKKKEGLGKITDYVAEHNLNGRLFAKGLKKFVAAHSKQEGALHAEESAGEEDIVGSSKVKARKFQKAMILTEDDEELAVLFQNIKEELNTH